MSLTKIEILGYRGFQQRGVIDFAVPNGTHGSGLTLITGPNNAGKSCILECLRARSGANNPSFTVGTRNADVQSVEIKYVVGGKEEFIKSIAKGSSEAERHGVDLAARFFVLPSRRAFNAYFSKSEWTREVYVGNNGLPPQRAATLNGFEYRLFRILKDPAVFNALLKEALGFEPLWTIDQSDHGQHFLKFFNGDHSHSSDGMGEGIISLFSIIDSLYDSKAGDVVIIDEPELSLHPSLQKRVAAMLARFAADRQIVLSTHSPYFVDLQALISGGHLVRVTTTVGKGTQINSLTSASKDAIRRLSEGNLYNPHVFGLDARELFFQEERIILTEGQEDVLLYPKLANQVSATVAGNFFGWGVGGAGNIAHLCRILQDLGFRKVAGLLDGDKAAEAKRLSEQFPSYFFTCIPAKDIRTKPARKATEEVAGLMDEKLTVKPEFVADLKALFGALSTHMDSVASA
jgi:predicted ATP-dependent endonuclease of OLD family